MPYANPAHKKINDRRYYRLNKKQIYQQHKLYVAKNRTRVNAAKRKWQQRNPQKMYASKRKWRLAHLERGAAAALKHWRKLRQREQFVRMLVGSAEISKVIGRRHQFVATGGKMAGRLH